MWKETAAFWRGIFYPETPFKGRYVLVVDDGESERQFYSRVLKKAGYAVSAVSCAQDALTEISRKKPDVVLMDFCMSDMNGDELCRCLKSSDQTSDIPVVFLTGSTRPVDVVGCFEAGGECFLTKPINAQILVRQVDTVLSDCEQRRAGTGVMP